MWLLTGLDAMASKLFAIFIGKDVFPEIKVIALAENERYLVRASFANDLPWRLRSPLNAALIS